MFIEQWNKELIHLMCFMAVLAGVAEGSVRRPPPTPEITVKGNFLNFHASPPNSTSPHCWKYVFQYRKCNEGPVTVNVTEKEDWTAKVEYDVACKYTVWVQAKYDTKYCGKVELDSDMSKPVYFGQDNDPNLPFKVAMIVIPVMACACLVLAIVLFRRNKNTFFPKVPSPAHFFTTMVESNTEMKKDLYVRELYVPSEEVVDQIHVASETTHLHNGIYPVTQHKDGDENSDCSANS